MSSSSSSKGNSTNDEKPKSENVTKKDPNKQNVTDLQKHNESSENALDLKFSGANEYDSDEETMKEAAWRSIKEHLDEIERDEAINIENRKIREAVEKQIQKKYM